ncbi:MAG: hypothetical protein FWH49_00655 [Clostridiales bacterium]|nr:hypothetical protein [Clostridiales bacterium]
MNKKTKLATILICILLFSACGNNQRNSTIPSSEGEKEAVTEAETSPSMHEMTPDADNPEIGIETATPERDWKDVYEAVLHGDNPEQINYLERILPAKEEDGADTLIYHGVGLYDIDANDVPELFVFMIGNEWYSYDVYTCENDAAKLLLRSPAGSIERATGILFNFGMDSYFTDDVAFRYENGELVEIPDYAETLFGEGRYRLGNRIFELDSDAFFDIPTFFDYEDAVNYFASGITESQSSSTHMTGEVAGSPIFFEDIGKPYSILMNEHPTATIVSDHIVSSKRFVQSLRE